VASGRGGKRDYYEVLGVPRNADDVELKRAFRELARKYHPDVNDGQAAEDTFKEANEAYAVLSDPRKRARYDRYGHTGVGGETAEGGFGTVVDAFDDLLGDLWRRRKTKKRGRDHRYTLEISFEEAAFGCEKTIKIPDSVREPGKPVRDKQFVVTVPPGTKEGTVRRIKGEGERGKGGAPAGDLHVIIRVVEHSVFRAEGHDVWCDVPVTFPQAALGSVLEVPTLDGVVKMKIPEGTQSGRVLRMRGKGIPKSSSKNGMRGDQMVKIIVETPTGLSARQRDLLESFAAEAGVELAHPQKTGFLDKLRSLLQN
jgi:molecular chaperone DnaJ